MALANIMGLCLLSGCSKEFSLDYAGIWAI